MSRSDDRTPATQNGNGAGEGPARGYSWPPFEPGHELSLKHGLDGRLFRPLDREEIAEVADALREVCPEQVRQPALEPLLQLLAARIWRLRRAYAYLAETPEAELPRHFNEKLNSLELLINRTLSALGLTPVSASELGINLARLAAAAERGPSFEWSALSERERRQLERLLAKGRPVATEAAIREAERARLEALVDQHATEREKFSLLVSGVMRHGISVPEYEGLEPSRRRSPDPVLLETIARRVERRVRLSLPAAACAGDPPYGGCGCLEEALDSGARSRGAVLKAAGALHWAPPLRHVRREASEKSQEAAAVPLEATERVPEGPPRPAPKPEPPPERHGVVRRTPKWYDPDPSILDRTF